jgi:hypothetical protein
LLSGSTHIKKAAGSLGAGNIPLIRQIQPVDNLSFLSRSAVVGLRFVAGTRLVQSSPQPSMDLNWTWLSDRAFWNKKVRIALLTLATFIALC